MDVSDTPEVLLRRAATPQAALPLSTPGVQRWVWEGRYGSMLIEVIGERVFVDGQPVEPHAAEHPPGSGG
jgi:hypothetical protein